MATRRCDDSIRFHEWVANYHRKQGWNVIKEYPQEYFWRDGRNVNGRIDLWIEKNGETVAIECDYKRPRIRSVLKLALCAADHCYVYCRNGERFRLR